VAKEIVAWCDIHLADDEHRSGKPVQITIGGLAREIDLCNECTKEYVEPLRELLEAVGQPLDRAPAPTPLKDKEHVCPVAGCGREYAYLKSLTEHIVKAHPELADQYAPEVCGECGERFATERGMRRHAREIHGVGFNEPLPTIEGTSG
jgi:hypothetical protein